MRISPKYTQIGAIAILGAATVFTVAILIFIVIFVLQKGLPILSFNFLFTNPTDMGRSGGILPILIGTTVLPVLAIVIAAPLGIGTSVYIVEFTHESRVTRLIRFGTDCLAGVPSIIFGLFGFIFFVTILGMGWSIMSGGLSLAFMILPTIIRTSEEAIRSVPKAYREVSFSLGASRWQTVRKVILPNALPGIVTGIVLGVGRSIEETAVVIFTAGSSLLIPTSLFDSTRTMAVHFYILAREGLSMKNAYGTAASLIIAVLIVNLSAYWIMHRFIAKRN
jgi:phosphate transport system permease protein